MCDAAVAAMSVTVSLLLHWHALVFIPKFEPELYLDATKNVIP
jgi:hypothetical protein